MSKDYSDFRVSPRAKELIRGWLKEDPAEEPDIWRIAKIVLQLRYPSIEVTPGEKHPNSASVYSQQYIADLFQERGYACRRTTVSNIENMHTDTIQDRTVIALTLLLSEKELEQGSDEWNEALNDVVYWAGVKRPLETMARKSHLQRVENLEGMVADLCSTVEELTAEVAQLSADLYGEPNPNDPLYIAIREALIAAKADPDTESGRKKILDTCSELKTSDCPESVDMILGIKPVNKLNWLTIAKLMTWITGKSWTHDRIKSIAHGGHDKSPSADKHSYRTH